MRSCKEKVYKKERSKSKIVTVRRWSCRPRPPSSACRPADATYFSAGDGKVCVGGRVRRILLLGDECGGWEVGFRLGTGTGEVKYLGFQCMGSRWIGGLVVFFSFGPEFWAGVFHPWVNGYGD
jgi:hypothetical protein